LTGNESHASSTASTPDAIAEERELLGLIARAAMDGNFALLAIARKAGLEEHEGHFRGDLHDACLEEIDAWYYEHRRDPSYRPPLQEYVALESPEYIALSGMIEAAPWFDDEEWTAARVKTLANRIMARAASAQDQG
jgi:hypothetical protein